MQRQHSATSSSGAAPAPTPPRQRGKKRGNYSCGRCGLPKKGHSCHIGTEPTAAHSPPRHLHDDSHHQLLRRALSFNDVDVAPSDGDDETDGIVAATLLDLDGGSRMPSSCLAEVLKRLPPAALMSAAMVCRGWRDCSRRIWRAAEELRLRVPSQSPVGFVGSVVNRCPGLVRLSLWMESDVDATVMACIAFSCPNLEALEIRTADSTVNRITGDELGRFVAEKRCLSSLKIDGCTNLGFLSLCSSSLSTLWLSDLHSISKMVFNCPNLKELSLDFSRQENDSTDLVIMVNNLGRSCSRLRNIHIASVRLSHAVVLALTNANFRGLRMLSLVLGSEITDASVAAIASCYENLELLDLSGSSITDSGIGMICNVFPETLSRLLLAVCPNITSSGIQFAAAQLPLLQLMDCGMIISDPSSPNIELEENGSQTDEISCELSYHKKVTKKKQHSIYQKLIIKHGRLRKLSLWGCSGLDALYLNCPELNDLNLNSCRNLHPERLLLQCPNLQSVHASGCQDLLIGAIQSQVSKDFAAMENHFPCKRLADGSKRVRVPHFLSQQSFDEKGKRANQQPSSLCTVHVD